MTTPGRITIEDVRDPERQIHLYCFADGHLETTIKDLIGLPCALVQLASQGLPGTWFYDRVLEGLASGDDHYQRTGVPIYTSQLGIANWLVWQRFNHWHIVPDLSWCPYPGGMPDVRVLVDDDPDVYDATVSYTLEIQPEAQSGIESGFAAGFWQAISAQIDQLNEEVPDLVKLRVEGDLRQQDGAWHFPRIRVPFDALILYFMALRAGSKKRSDQLRVETTDDPD